MKLYNSDIAFSLLLSHLGMKQGFAHYHCFLLLTLIPVGNEESIVY